MGLDFGIYYKKKNEAIPDWETDYNAYYEWMNKHELCYGRKSWELVHALRLPIDDGEDPIVEKEYWDELIASMKTFLGDNDSSYFDIIRDDYCAIDKYHEMDVDVPPDILNRVVQYEVWYDKTFDETPHLGYDFALGYLAEFYKADEQIQKYFNDEYEVRAYVSY